jgi:hypothetical protein
MTNPRTPITLPDNFEEDLEKSLHDITENYIESGTVSIVDLAWLFTGVRNTVKLMEVSANFVNVAEHTVAEKDAEIARLKDKLRAVYPNA